MSSFNDLFCSRNRYRWTRQYVGSFSLATASRSLSWMQITAPGLSCSVSTKVCPIEISEVARTDIGWVVIEGDKKAVLYTGDIRSEPWFINSIARNPSVIEFSSGIKTLDTIYLDTSFTANIPFQTKADGIQKLLRQVSRYPKDTIFHFQAWTFGYEDVWIALSKALKSRVSIRITALWRQATVDMCPTRSTSTTTSWGSTDLY